MRHSELIEAVKKDPERAASIIEALRDQNIKAIEAIEELELRLLKRMPNVKRTIN